MSAGQLAGRCIRPRDRYAGEIERRWSVYGRHVVLFDARQPGADANVDPAEARWWTMCDEHGTLASHASRRLAREHLVPAEWCEQCRRLGGEQPAARPVSGAGGDPA